MDEFEFASTDVADALAELGIKSFLPGITMKSPDNLNCRLFGRVYTVKMISATELPKEKFDLHYADSIPEKHIAVISAPENSVNAVWGGLLTTRAKELGVKGVVIDGNCRDLLELRDLEFPVFSSGISCYGAGGFTKVSEVNVDVTVAGVKVSPGDYAVADIDGAVVIPKDRFDEVVGICKKNKVRDEKCMKDLLQGITLTETFKRYR